jgi:hypothetical protein
LLGLVILIRGNGRKLGSVLITVVDGGEQ